MQSQSEPLVSVVIPCYNHAQFVQDCIQSVIDQTYANIELIIIDDGSKDQSVEKIEEMLDKCRSRFSRFEFRHRPNKGLSATLNEALEWCQGKYFSVIASDDMMLKDKTQVQVSYLLNADDNVTGVFGGYQLIDNKNKAIECSVRPHNQFSHNQIIMHNFELPAPTALLKLNKIREVGGYLENIKLEDWYMWLKLTENGDELVYISEKLCNYRTHNDNFSKNLDLMHYERIRVLNFFKNNKNYHSAMRNIEWYQITDHLKNSKKKSLLQFFQMIKKYPFEIFSRNMVRFVYYFIKSS